MKRFGLFSLLFLVGVQGFFSSHGGAAEPSRTLTVASPAERGDRVAVVIGNSRYPSGALANPRNDATAMAASLRKLGFDVELKLDATKADMDAVFKRFSGKAEKAGVAALFYAGHGIQVNGSNYIVPIDAKPQTERDLKREMVRMDDVIDDMGGAKVKLVFFDACRDNPLSRSFSRGGSRGMAAPVEATGTLISFATKHGNTAADGDAEHSPYTAALLAALTEAGGVEIEQMLRKVQQSVKQATNGQQEPWRYGSLDGDFYFLPPMARASAARAEQDAVDRVVQEAVKRASDQAAAEAMRRAAEQQASSATTVELSFWDSIKNSPSADDFREYLASYPQGRFAGLARNRIRSLEAAPALPAAKPAPQAAALSASAPPPGPVQIAMVAPKPTPTKAAQHVAAPASAYPQAGDTWTYRYVDAWKKNNPLTVVVKVEEVEGGKVTDRMSLRGGRVSDERTHEGAAAVERSLGSDVRVIELLPYVQPLLLENLKPGQERSLPDISISGQSYKAKARFIGREKVSTAAGTFDAMKLEIDGQRPAIGTNISVPLAITHTVWFAPEVKRAVKVEHRSGNSIRPRIDDESMELVSFTGSALPASASTGTESLAEMAPSMPAAELVLVPPKAGDSWIYRYVNGWKQDSPKTVFVKVEESEGGRVTDRMSLRGGRGADERTYEGNADGAQRVLGDDVGIFELLPYVQGLLQSGLKPGQEARLAEISMAGQPFVARAKFVRMEKVSVAAGTFDAVKLEIVGQRTGQGLTAYANLSVPTTFTHTVWFAPDVRRTVKVEHKSGSTLRARIDDETLELVSFSLR